MSRRNNQLLNPAARQALERMKLEIADELGLTAKIQSQGWANLTTAEVGQIGGQMVRKLIQRAEENL